MEIYRPLAPYFNELVSSGKLCIDLIGEIKKLKQLDVEVEALARKILLHSPEEETQLKQLVDTRIKVFKDLTKEIKTYANEKKIEIDVESIFKIISSKYLYLMNDQRGIVSKLYLLQSLNNNPVALKSTQALMSEFIEKNYNVATILDSLNGQKNSGTNNPLVGGGADEEVNADSYVSIIDNDIKGFNLTIVPQKEVKKIVKDFFENFQNFFNTIRDARAKDPVYRALAEKELLEEELARPREPKVKKTKKKNKKSNKNKGGGGGAKAPPAVPEGASAALPKISDKKRAISGVYKPSELSVGQVRMHPSMKQWEEPNLTDISSWEKYSGLDEEGQREQIIAHTVGIGAERLLNHPELRREYVWDTERGLMMSCLVKLKDGQELYGKVHFVLNQENKVYHRMFFQAKPEYSMEEFLLERGDLVEPIEAAAAAQAEEETMVGRYSWELHADQRIEYTLANNAFVESYTIFSFNT